MSDDDIIAQGGTQDDIDSYAENHGATDPGSFTCGNCHETFTKEWTDEEASVEFSQNFTGASIKNTETVCDDCYNKMFPTNFNHHLRPFEER